MIAEGGLFLGTRTCIMMIAEIHSPKEGGHMSWKSLLAIPVSILFLFASGCNLPGGTVTTIATNPPVAVPLNTQVAEVVASTQAAQTALANGVAASLTAMPTNTPQFTFTPSLTPTQTFTLTPGVTTVSVSVNTFCRTGPGDPYDILGTLPVGQTAEVVGRSATNDFWIIKLPPQGINCWLWGQYATVTGNSSGLSVINPPPSPTPAGSFKVLYSSVQTCSTSYGIKFQITNNGSVTWESNKVKVTDNTTSETGTVSYDTFPNYSSSDCSLISSDANLGPGEVGTTSIFGFSTDPTDDSFTATIRVCSLNGLAGICMEKTISFAP